jgi:general secretion pathway protein C
MVLRFAAFVIWAAVAASAVFWALRFGARPTAVPAYATVVGTTASVNGDLERLFGSDAVAAAPEAVAAPPPADPRFKLVGVVAPRAPGAAGGLALIALDDKPPRAFRVGAAVDGDMVLQAVRARGATLGLPGQPARVDLQLPALPPPATGVPGAVGGLPRSMAGSTGLSARPLPVPLPAPVQSEDAQDEPPDGAPDRSTNAVPPGRPATPPPPSPGRARPL